MRKVFFGELVGTFILVFFGCASVAVAVLTGALVGLWQVAVVWGIAVALGIYVSSGLSGGHLNPAITLSLAVWKRTTDVKTTAVYIAGQLAGAVLAGALLYLLFSDVIRAFEATNHIVRGGEGSQLSAMMFGEYFPNPAIAKAAAPVLDTVGIWRALFAEAVGTALLALAIFAMGRSRINESLKPLVVGAALAAIISVIAPLTQAGLNPARDFGPRLVAFAAGWGSIAIPGPHAGFWVYVVGPLVGALVAGGAYVFIFENGAAGLVSSRRGE